MHKRILIVDPANRGAELAAACKTSALSPFLIAPEGSGVNGSSAAQAITVSKLDAESIIHAARRHGVQGIWATTREGWLAALPAAERLNMPRLDATGITHLHKDLLKKFAAAGVAVAPSHMVATSVKAKAAAEELGYPVWVRGIDDLGISFTMVVEEEAELSLAYKKARKYAQSGAIQVQKVVEGPTYRVLGLKEGRHFHPVEAIAETVAEGAFRYATAYAVPCGLGGYDYTRVIDMARKAGGSLPSGFGPVSVEIVLTDDGPVLVQVRETPEIDLHGAAVIKAALGVDLIADALRLAVGDEPKLTPSKEIAAALVWLPEVTGKVAKVEGLKEAQAITGVLEAKVNVAKGDKLAHVQDVHSRDRLGYVLAYGINSQKARETAQTALENIHIKTQKAKV